MHRAEIVSSPGKLRAWLELYLCQTSISALALRSSAELTNIQNTSDHVIVIQIRRVFCFSERPFSYSRRPLYYVRQFQATQLTLDCL
jgi:hypothetical protein